MLFGAVQIIELIPLWVRIAFAADLDDEIEQTHRTSDSYLAFSQLQSLCLVRNSLETNSEFRFISRNCNFLQRELDNTDLAVSEEFSFHLGIGNAAFDHRTSEAGMLGFRHLRPTNLLPVEV